MDLNISNTVIIENHSDIPSPLVFNCWKHHRGFIQRQIKEFAAEDYNGIKRIIPKLLLIGTSQIDIYTGILKEEQIAAETVERLQKMGVYNENEYINWLKSARDNFEMIRLSDESYWTLRIGISKQRYIHIHPGRHTFNSIRVRSNTLKTSILALLASAIEGSSPFSLTLINETRAKILGLAPIKSIEKASGLKDLVTLLADIPG